MINYQRSRPFTVATYINYTQAWVSQFPIPNAQYLIKLLDKLLLETEFHPFEDLRE
jgi:hypothetical protein